MTALQPTGCPTGTKHKWAARFLFAALSYSHPPNTDCAAFFLNIVNYFCSPLVLIARFFSYSSLRNRLRQNSTTKKELTHRTALLSPARLKASYFLLFGVISPIWVYIYRSFFIISRHMGSRWLTYHTPYFIYTKTWLSCSIWLATWQLLIGPSN